MNDRTSLDTTQTRALLIELMTDPDYPLVRAALELLAPINEAAARTLRVVRACDSLIDPMRAEQATADLRQVLRQPGVLDGLRAKRDAPLAQDLLWVAESLRREA
jgi:hypothetical protein